MHNVMHNIVYNKIKYINIIKESLWQPSSFVIASTINYNYLHEKPINNINYKSISNFCWATMKLPVI